ncbi:hypothetical protein SPRG_21049 [Saprolegnia parasitica CBS 223.65]|uniref:HTH CENPB-type domain-containing protein n=1 Tax=Saprolegnia parasitica (strain CBS 223.65) TaxID=695850 RepID=A0A067C6S6_SAPPC|nr:hypothetical protein SPRG_21049 [Saprolegnia parasitica CBS 223.65]KDO22522.1 hypothetical protein SPRG_21049 [Saprolegnia parasitica CBS 223.65]|eukprot:XP_012206805.1 hypothetical protein SPRG_21049 [Saprolegnia parasitica CBS 223.65]
MGSDEPPVAKIKKPAKELSVHEKAVLIAQASRGHATNSKLAKQFGVSSATVSRILKRKHEYITMAKATDDDAARKRKFRTDTNALLSSLVYKWYQEATGRNVLVTGPMLREKALRLATELSIPDFKASNGWMDNFRQRYHIANLQTQSSLDALFEKTKPPEPPMLTPDDLAKDDALDEVAGHDAAFTHFIAPPPTPTAVPPQPTYTDLLQRVHDLEAQVAAMQAWQTSFERSVAQQREEDAALLAAKALAHDAQLTTILDLLKHAPSL